MSAEFEKNANPGEIRTYEEAERVYRPAGYAPIPVGSDKQPVTKGWVNLTPSAEEIADRIRRHGKANVGLLAGTDLDKGMVLGFVDIDHEAVVAVVCAFLGAYATAKKGAKGLTIVCRAEKGSKSVKIHRGDKSGKPLVEFFLNSGMVVIPDSMHPKGMRYQWVGKPLLRARPEDHPIVTDSKIDLLRAVLGNENAWTILDGGAGVGGHEPMLKLTSSGIADMTDDLPWLAGCLGALFDPAYTGNTKEEILGMLESAKSKGLGAGQHSGDGEKAKYGKGRVSAADIALKIMRSTDISLFHNDQGVAFAGLAAPECGTRCLPIRSDAMKSFVRLRYHSSTGKMLGRDALGEVIDLMEARAIYEREAEEVFVRLGTSADGAIYYDLGRPDGKVVEITRDGWSIVADCDLHFHRPARFGSQVVPEPGGDLTALKDLLHLDDKNWVLFLAFLIVSLQGKGPFMLLLVGGAHGSGKSKLCELAKRIVDPNALEKIRLPKEEHTLALHAAENYLLVYDNASSVRWDMSDAMCALTTGAGFSSRKFYSDSETTTFKNARPVVINGIGEFANRQDLLDRSIPLKLPTMPDGTRMAERAIDARFAAILPGILGCLFDIVSMALRRHDEVDPPTTIRMADAAQWLAAAEPATGLPAGAFLSALEAGVHDLMTETAVNDPLVIALFKLLDATGPERCYSGTMGDLFESITREDFRTAAQLPKTAAHLSNALQRLAPGMAKLGLMMELQPRTSKAKPVRLWIEEREMTPEPDPMVKRLW